MTPDLSQTLQGDGPKSRRRAQGGSVRPPQQGNICCLIQTKKSGTNQFMRQLSYGSALGSRLNVCFESCTGNVGGFAATSCTCRAPSRLPHQLMPHNFTSGLYLCL